MKPLLNLFALFAVGQFLACNPQNSATSTDRKACDSVRRADTAEIAYADQLVRKAHADSLREAGLRPFKSQEIQIDFAKEYVKEFQGSHCQALRNDMGQDYEAHFSFDSRTLGTFAALYNQGAIDGFKVYLAKYTMDPSDGNAQSTHYALIIVGTKSTPNGLGQMVNDSDVLIPNPQESNLYLDLQDYSNPCPNPPCQGDELPGN